MDTLMHADIFFFVTTVAVVAVALLLIIALFYVIRILREVRDIGHQIKEETVLFREDLKFLRTDVRREGFRLERFISFFRTIGGKWSRSKHKKS